MRIIESILSQFLRACVGITIEKRGSRVNGGGNRSVGDRRGHTVTSLESSLASLAGSLASSENTWYGILATRASKRKNQKSVYWMKI